MRRQWRFYLLALSVVLAMVGTGAHAAGWRDTASMQVARYGHTATLLANGQVLVTGGADTSSPSELYDPLTGTWSDTGTMIRATRRSHTATLLQDGRVLVAGGLLRPGGATATAELYDPSTGVWTDTARMSSVRVFHSATLLNDGRVLVAGGGFTQTAELYDPSQGAWTAASSMHFGRAHHTATLLGDGTVLVVGGAFVAEIFDPATGAWSDTDSPAIGRVDFTATLLADGRVLIAGSCIDSDAGTCAIETASAELYVPSIRAFSVTGSMGDVRAHHAAALFSGGRVLATGGEGAQFYGDNPQLATAELYDPSTGTWGSTISMRTGRSSHTATQLNDGTVLVTGDVELIACSDDIFGFFICAPLSVTATAELFSP